MKSVKTGERGNGHLTLAVLAFAVAPVLIGSVAEESHKVFLRIGRVAEEPHRVCLRIGSVAEEPHKVCVRRGNKK